MRNLEVGPTKVENHPDHGSFQIRFDEVARAMADLKPSITLNVPAYNFPTEMTDQEIQEFLQEAFPDSWLRAARCGNQGICLVFLDASQLDLGLTSITLSSPFNKVELENDRLPIPIRVQMIDTLRIQTVFNGQSLVAVIDNTKHLPPVGFHQ